MLRTTQEKDNGGVLSWEFFRFFILKLNFKNVSSG